MNNRRLRKTGRSLTDCEASASIATRPPSPWLSARSTSSTYLTDTIVVKVQTKSDSTPNTLAGVKSTWPEPNTSLTAYSTLVPMSPYTTPMAPKVSAAKLEREEDTNQGLLAQNRSRSQTWRYCAPVQKDLNRFRTNVAVQQLLPAPTSSVKILRFRIRCLQLVAGSEHGQTSDHPVHVKTIRHADTGLDARLR